MNQDDQAVLWTWRRMLAKTREIWRNTMAGEPKGLYGKYKIIKTDGSSIDPKAIYFTLRLDTDRHARAAIRAYIESCQESEPDLARDLERVLHQVEKR